MDETTTTTTTEEFTGELISSPDWTDYIGLAAQIVAALALAAIALKL